MLLGLLNPPTLVTMSGLLCALAASWLAQGGEPELALVGLIGAGLCERVCWVVPRDSLRLQAEEAFVDPHWRTTLGHNLTVRAAENAPDPCRGLQGYVTTYQAVAAAPELGRHCRRRRPDPRRHGR